MVKQEFLETLWASPLKWAPLDANPLKDEGDIDIASELPPAETIALLLPALADAGFQLVTEKEYDTGSVRFVFSAAYSKVDIHLDVLWDPKGLSKYRFPTQKFLDASKSDRSALRNCYLRSKRHFKGEFDKFHLIERRLSCCNGACPLVVVRTSALNRWRFLFMLTSLYRRLGFRLRALPRYGRKITQLAHSVKTSNDPNQRRRSTD